MLRLLTQNRVDFGALHHALPVLTDGQKLFGSERMTLVRWHPKTVPVRVDVLVVLQKSQLEW